MHETQTSLSLMHRCMCKKPSLHAPNTVYVVYLAVILIWRFGDFSSVRQI